MSENIPLQELRKKYPEIRFHKLSNPPYTEWIFVEDKKLIPIPLTPHHIVVYRSEHGDVLAYWKGLNPHKTPIFILNLEAAHHHKLNLDDLMKKDFLFERYNDPPSSQ